MAKSKIKKYKDGGGYQDESGKSISKSKADKIDKNLTKSITGYKGFKSIHDQQKEEKTRNLAAEATRQQRIKQNPVAASTYVKKPQVKMKLGGSCSTPKRLKK
jgi:hypothetical protein